MARAQKPRAAAPSASDSSSTDDGATKVPNPAQRKIPGNLPYITASGTLKKVLDRSIEASRPDKFNSDFLENVLKITGGSARATIPILKRLGFLTSDGTPTDLYARFRTDSGRSSAAFQALRTGFPEIFKRSEYAHSVDDAKIIDIIVEITGLNPGEGIVSFIKNTFNVIRSYISKDAETQPLDTEIASAGDSNQGQGYGQANLSISAPNNSSRLGLVYNINVVLPETSDLRVLNAIFRSLKENLLQ